ncbi:MAG: type II toxin-antitoxin system VapC family toxin [Terracidiphilus sp.]
MILILDASMALAWLLDRKDPGEAALAGEALDVVRASGAMVPALWFSEVANALLLAERQRVITAQDSASYLSGLSLMAIILDDVSPELQLTRVLDLGRMHKLTAYDATYLELGMRRAATLATFDRQLTATARAAGVHVFGDPA